MKKRFTDCDCWKDPWFRRMKPVDKLTWKYIIENCECWGEWKPDPELAGFMVGEELDLECFLTVANYDKLRITVLGNGNWYINDFLSFQYGELSPHCNAHKPVIQHLNRMFEKREEKPVKAEPVKKKKSFDELFEQLWEKYPRKIEKRKAKSHFNATVKTEQDQKDIVTALDNYLASKQVREAVTKGEIQFIKHGSTWFNNWRDYITQEVIKPSDPYEGIKML